MVKISVALQFRIPLNNRKKCLAAGFEHIMSNCQFGRGCIIGLKEGAYQTLPLSARSPDPSLIEPVWDIMGRRLHLPRNVDDLAQQLDQIWQEIPQEIIRVLYHFMSRHVATCIQARDGSSDETFLNRGSGVFMTTASNESYQRVIGVIASCFTCELPAIIEALNLYETLPILEQAKSLVIFCDSKTAFQAILNG
ncbi:transposable element Tcb1 transposase [Trichonephila clavipes]|nr:transposable element Tcb1 transposase [Trichonephila clavipes]